MATIKSFTDLEQSKKLAEFLPLETADMWYHGHGSPWESERVYDSDACPFHSMSPNWDKPCWSLAALFGILTENKICHYDNRYYCQYISEGGEFPIYSTPEYDNPVDACVNMFEKLHELKML